MSCVLLLSISTQAQLNPNIRIRVDESVAQNAKTPSKNPFVLDSIFLSQLRQSIFILRQDYCLYDKKKKKYYGYEGEDQFGTTLSVGLKCQNFNILMDEAIHPWKYDEKYSQFDEKHLVPTITRSRYTMIDETDPSRYTEPDSIIDAKQTIKDDFVYIGEPLVSNQEGLVLNTTDTCKVGVIVWVVEEKDSTLIRPSKFGLRYSITKAEMFGLVNITPPAKNEIVLGGFYLTETGNKDVPYQLAGITTLRDERWTLSFPFRGFKIDGPKVDSKGKLTEVKITNKEVKQ